MEPLKPISNDGPPIKSILPHILLPIFMILGLASPSFKGRGLVWSVAIAYLVYRTLVDEFPADKQLKYALSCSWLWYVPTVQKLLCSEPEKAYWRLDRPRAEATHMPFGLKKIQWATALWLNPRGIGWNYQIKRLLPFIYATNRRRQFFFRQSLSLVEHYLTIEAALLYLSRFPFPKVLDDMTWRQYVSIGLDCGILIYASWQVQWITASIVGVATGLSQPKVGNPLSVQGNSSMLIELDEDWPAFFGKASEVTTVGHFWGSYWQQVLHQVRS